MSKGNAASTSIEVPSTNLTNRAIGSYAERVVEHFGLLTDPGPVDLDALLGALGGTTEVSRGPESLKIYGDGTFVISVHPTTTARRDRVAISHQLGHYYLHFLLPKKRGPHIFMRGGKSCAETEAAIFGVALLTPSWAFTQAWRDCEDIRAVARVFDVSPRLAQTRGSVLGLCA